MPGRPILSTGAHAEPPFGAKPTFTSAVKGAVIGSRSGSHARLCVAQSQRDVRYQIGWVFDPDRQPDCGVENAYFTTDFSWNARVGHACGQASKRLGAAEAHGQLDDLQRVQEFECGGLTADNVERERGASAGALSREHTTGGGYLFEVSGPWPLSLKIRRDRAVGQRSWPQRSRSAIA
jgi:hypothetical protein